MPVNVMKVLATDEFRTQSQFLPRRSFALQLIGSKGVSGKVDRRPLGKTTADLQGFDTFLQGAHRFDRPPPGARGIRLANLPREFSEGRIKLELQQGRTGRGRSGHRFTAVKGEHRITSLHQRIGNQGAGNAGSHHNRHRRGCHAADLSILGQSGLLASQRGTTCPQVTLLSYHTALMSVR